MSNYTKAYKELVASGLVDRHVIERHVKEQIAIDKLLPNTASFFLIAEINTLSYSFLGKQVENVSGYPREVFQEKGFEMFFQCVHPEDIEILLKQILPDFAIIVAEAAPEDKKNIQFQYNYRFKRKNGDFVNLLEQSYVLEVDDQGRGAVTLCNVILLDNIEQLPIRWSAKIRRNNSISETIFLKTHHIAEHKIKDITTRELDILRNLAAGKTSKEIGKKLFISPHTVDTHRRNLLSKLECRSVVELAQIAFSNGLL